VQSERKIRILFLTALAALALYLCYLIAAPFLRPILSAITIAIVVSPLHRQVRRYLPQPNAAALLATVFIALLLLLPGVWLTQVLSEEVRHVFQLLNQQVNDQGGWSQQLARLSATLTRWLNRFASGVQFDLRASLSGQLERLSGWLVARAASLFTNLTGFVIQAVIAFVTLFFFLRDGRKMWRAGAAYLPLLPAQIEQLAASVSETILASVYGVFAVGFVQGALTGLAFWFLGLPSPLLWGVVAAFFSLVPLVGTSLVWLPAALILIASGHWGKGLLLLGWGAAVVSMSDNVVRPLVLSETTRMHGLQIFIVLLGGLQAFGLIGLFVGPVVLAVTKATLQILKQEYEDWRVASGATPASVAAPSIQNVQ
jgi:predicted PurR-regulated permease PerM